MAKFNWSRAKRINYYTPKSYIKTPKQQEREIEQIEKKLLKLNIFTEPYCQFCSTKMTARRNHKNKSLFWGCKNFPKCKFTLPIENKQKTENNCFTAEQSS